MPKLKNVVQFDKIDPKSTYLLLVNPEKIPHLILIKNGRYFSLTYKESVVDQDFHHYFKKLKRLNKKMIFIRLSLDPNTVNQEFSNYLAANSTDLTCFVPIKNILLPKSKAEMIHELIPELYENQFIEEVSHLNLDSELNDNGEFSLSVYTKKMIFSYIQHLKNKDAIRK